MDISNFCKSKKRIYLTIKLDWVVLYTSYFESIRESRSNSFNETDLSKKFANGREIISICLAIKDSVLNKKR